MSSSGCSHDNALVSLLGATQREPPTVASLQDLTIIESWDPITNLSKYINVYLVTPDEHVYFGHSSKNKRDTTLADYSTALELVPDVEVYPEVPKDVQLTVASKSLDNSSAHVKHSGLKSYESVKGTNFVPKALLDETLIMELMSKSPHPNIISYYGFRVRRGRITAFVVERLG